MQGHNDNINFHNYPLRLSYLLTRINPIKYGFVESKRGVKRIPFDLIESNRQLIERYYIDLTNEGLTKPRILAILDQTTKVFVCQFLLFVRR
jgi:hypothetical protein